MSGRCSALKRIRHADPALSRTPGASAIRKGACAAHGVPLLELFRLRESQKGSNLPRPDHAYGRTVLHLPAGRPASLPNPRGCKDSCASTKRVGVRFHPGPIEDARTGTAVDPLAKGR